MSDVTTTTKQRLEAHATACRAAIAKGLARPLLPDDLRDLAGAQWGALARRIEQGAHHAAP